MVGALGVAREELAPEGLVFVSGGLWKAVADPNPIHVGSRVRVVAQQGHQLHVVAENRVLTESKEKR
jgi:membrane-bound ClpP family serine protease